MTQKFGDGFDWRGTKIKVGDTVIYGAGVGRSIALVEAEVLEVNGAKVKLKVKYRAYGGSYRDTVTVGCDRLTVVIDLPPCALKSAQEEIEARDKRTAERKANRESHLFKPKPREPRQTDPEFKYVLPSTVTIIPSTTGYAGGGGAYYTTNTTFGNSYPIPSYPQAAQLPNGKGYYDPNKYRAAYQQWNIDYQVWIKNPCTRCPVEFYSSPLAPCAGA